MELCRHRSWYGGAWRPSLQANGPTGELKLHILQNQQTFPTESIHLNVTFKFAESTIWLGGAEDRSILFCAHPRPSHWLLLRNKVSPFWVVSWPGDQLCWSVPCRVDRWLPSTGRRCCTYLTGRFRVSEWAAPPPFPKRQGYFCTPPTPPHFSGLVWMFCWQLLLLCRRRQSGQILCQLSLQSSSFTLRSVSSYIR